jgi:adenine-specific DNA-methyltransferase
MYLVFQVKPAFTFDASGTYANNAVWIIPRSDKYLLGILNSKLGWFLISKNCTQIQRGYQLIFKYFGKIPIRPIDATNSADAVLHDQMVSLVDAMLSLKKQIAEARTSHEQTLLQRQIEAIDKRIDQLVYELYGLTEEEIKIVESGK